MNSNKAFFRQRKGFTFIEVLVTLSVIAISFLPMLRMFAVSIEQMNYTDDGITARYLSQEGMEKIKNLNFTENQLQELGDVWDPPLQEAAYIINGHPWRILRKIKHNSTPLEIHIQVYKEYGPRSVGTEQTPIVELVTLYQDLEWDF